MKKNVFEITQFTEFPVFRNIDCIKKHSFSNDFYSPLVHFAFSLIFKLLLCVYSSASAQASRLSMCAPRA